MQYGTGNESLSFFFFRLKIFNLFSEVHLSLCNIPRVRSCSINGPNNINSSVASVCTLQIETLTTPTLVSTCFTLIYVSTVIINILESKSTDTRFVEIVVKNTFGMFPTAVVESTLVCRRSDTFIITSLNYRVDKF